MGNQMRNPPSMSPRVHFPIHSWGTNRHCSSQFLTRYCSTRHVLCCSTLPLRSFHGGCIRTLIPPVHRIHSSRNLNKDSLWNYVHRCKSNFLPTTLPRASRNATTVLRLPRRLYSLKYSILNRIPYFTSSGYYVLIHSLRSICCQTRGIICRTNYD